MKNCKTIIDFRVDPLLSSRVLIQFAYSDTRVDISGPLQSLTPKENVPAMMPVNFSLHTKGPPPSPTH